MLKNKIQKKIFTNILAIITVLLVLMTNTITSEAAPQTVRVVNAYADSKYGDRSEVQKWYRVVLMYKNDTKYSKGRARRYPVKVVQGTNNSVYCMQKDLDSPINVDMNRVNATIDEGLMYILKNGQQIYQNGSATTYLTGTRERDYYITQAAVQLYLEKHMGQDQDIGWMESSTNSKKFNKN